MNKKRAVLVGFIGKLPYAGMSLWNLHYLVGLQDLGYEVFYVEKQNYPDEYYDLEADEMTSDPGPGLRYLRQLLPQYGMLPGKFGLLDLNNNFHGCTWEDVRTALDRADFVLTIGTPSWFDELERCSRRAFVDGDPVFTQAEMLEGGAASVLEHYEILFTYATRMGMADCTIPGAGRSWIPTRTLIATRLWRQTPFGGETFPITGLLHWAAGSDVTIDGQVYGHKDREFARFQQLPELTSQPFRLAVGGGAPRERLEQLGWKIVSPLEVTGTIPAYENFIATSRADFAIAKHAYVASRSGWFSDRSTCFLASGRPVLHQETGFSEWLPTGEGVLKFSNAADVLESLRSLDLDYARHSRAARRIAEEHFEAATVLGEMLDEAGLR
jgi:hypothetical protein